MEASEKEQWKPSIEELMMAIDAPRSCRKNYANLRMRIIEPAINELREKKAFVVACKPTASAGRLLV